MPDDAVLFFNCIPAEVEHLVERHIRQRLPSVTRAEADRVDVVPEHEDDTRVPDIARHDERGRVRCLRVIVKVQIDNDRLRRGDKVEGACDFLPSTVSSRVHEAGVRRPKKVVIPVGGKCTKELPVVSMRSLMLPL